MIASQISRLGLIYLGQRSKPPAASRAVTYLHNQLPGQVTDAILEDAYSFVVELRQQRD